MNTSNYEYLESIIPKDRILFEEPMSRHTTFRVGGPAACMVLVETEEELTKLIRYFKGTGHAYFILGNGSNLLVGDRGYRGTVLKFGPRMEEISVQDERLVVKAGALLAKVAHTAKENSLTGMEFAAGIPGSIGGGVVMNAGAYGGEMKQIVESVRVMNEDGEIMVLDNDTMEFGYRTSIIKNRPFIVLEVTLKLQKGNREEIAEKMEELSQQRRAKQPLEYPSAGSTFKRPEGYFAGKLIMDAGLRGYRIGGAQVSDKHCGFVVNIGNATAQDIREVIETVQERVQGMFRVLLETEVIFLGDF